MRKLLSFTAAFLLSVSFIGCSGEEPKDPTAVATPVASASPTAQDTDGSEGVAGAQGVNGSTGSNDGTTTSSKKPIKEQKLTMNIDDSTSKNAFQNGPSPEEIRAYQKRLSKKPKRKKHYSSGQNAPVFDTEMVEVNG